MSPPRDREDELERDDILGKDADKKIDSMLKDDDDEDDGPDNAAARREQRDRKPARREAVEEEDDDPRLAYGDDEEDDADVGQGRRARRNHARRQRERQAQQQIESLASHVVTLQTQLEGMSRGQLSLAAGDINGQIAQQQGHLDSIDAALAQAVKDGDDAKFARANRLRDEARDRLQGLAYEHRRLEAAAQPRQPQTQTQQGRPAATGPDPAAARHAERFMARNSWFDPDDPSDEDSQVVKAIEDTLANEGSNPRSGKHWVELERRIKARGLGDGGSVDDDQDDDRGEERRQRPARRSAGVAPRGGRGSGGRGTGGGDFKLTPFMREALDNEGLAEEKGLTEDQVKLRRKYIKTWREGTENAARSAARN